MAIIVDKAELILICLVTLTPQEFAPPSLGLLPFLFRSKTVDVDHSFGESLRSFLRQIMADTAVDVPMLIFA